MTDAFTTTPADPVAELVGEGKKFKDVADLAKGKVEADKFIEQLKAEQAALRAELAAKVDADKALAELRAEFRQLKEQRVAPPGSEVTPSGVQESDLKALIARTITETEVTKTAAQNIVTANNELVRHFGSVEKAQAVLKEKSQELGLSIDSLKQTASQSPTAFLRLVVPEVKVEPGNRVNGTVNTSALPNTPAGGAPKEGTKEYFDKLRVDNPKKYWRPETQQAIFKAAMAGTYDTTAGLDRG